MCSSRKYPYLSEISHCAVPENIHTPPTGGIGISWVGGGDGVEMKCMKLNWNFQKGGEVLEKLLSVGEVWIFSGTTHFCRHKERGEWQFLTGLFTFAQNHFIFGTQNCFQTPSNAVYLFSFFPRSYFS